MAQLRLEYNSFTSITDPEPKIAKDGTGNNFTHSFCKWLKLPDGEATDGNSQYYRSAVLTCNPWSCAFLNANFNSSASRWLTTSNANGGSYANQPLGCTWRDLQGALNPIAFGARYSYTDSRFISTTSDSTTSWVSTSSSSTDDYSVWDRTTTSDYVQGDNVEWVQKLCTLDPGRSLPTCDGPMAIENATVPPPAGSGQPPTPPPLPPPPPPSPPPLAVQAFFPVVACAELTHRFTAAALSGSPAVAADAVAGSTWALRTVSASGAAPLSPYTGAAVLTSASAVPSSFDAFRVGQSAWLLRNANGFALAPGASPGVLGAGGRGFSFALWFRLDDYRTSNPTQNVVMQLVLSAPGGGGRNVTLSLTVSYNATNSPVVALNAKLCCGGGGSVLGSDADYAVSTTDEFLPPPNGNTFAVGLWQHVVVAFDASGVQSGLFWNGIEQDAALGWLPVDLGALLGAPPPYGPIISGALGYDLTADPYFTPLWGAIGDLQVYADVEADAGMAAGLHTGSTARCVATPSPPLPPAPPGGYRPPPPGPPNPPPQAPREALATQSFALCVPGLTRRETLEFQDEFIDGVATYLTLLRVLVRVDYISTGCDSPSPPPAGAGRRLLITNYTSVYANASILGNATLANSTVGLVVDDVPASVLVAKLLPLFNASTAGAALATLNTFVNAALAAAGLPPLAAGLGTVGSLTLAPIAPPPPMPPPYPPGVTAATLLAAANAAKKANRGAIIREKAAQAVAYAIAGLVVLWLPVHAAVHAVQAAYKRRTAVTVELAVRLDGGGPDQRGARMSKLGAGVADADAEGEEQELTGRRFGAPKLAAALIDMLATEAAAAAAADLQAPPSRPALRPLLRTPLLAALGAKAATTASQRLAARKKPAGLAWRMKRWITSELHWQAREMRHAVRALRRCCGGSRDPVGKAFRAVPSAQGGFGATGAVLVEVTWRFGWSGRNSAACWRRRLRDGAQLAALEAAIAAGLAASAVEVVVQEPGADAAGVTDSAVVLALLDDEPHANLDKKLKEKRTTSYANQGTLDADADGRSAGVAPAVAARLEAVLALCALNKPSAGRASVSDDAPAAVLAL